MPPEAMLARGRLQVAILHHGQVCERAEGVGRRIISVLYVYWGPEQVLVERKL